MSEQVTRIPIKYSNSDLNIKLINGGNINLEEDYIFDARVKDHEAFMTRMKIVKLS